MKHYKITNLIMVVTLLVGLLAVVPASAAPPVGDDIQVPAVDTKTPTGPAIRGTKDIDQPNMKDYLRNLERQRLLETGLDAQASALAKTGTDRVLVILVEFAGKDVFTWEEGVSQWDPLGIADPNEYTGVVGDCSNIITQTTTFTYTGPLHNQIPRPLSSEDRSGDSIWTEDFTPEWYNDFMFESGVVMSYTMQDGTPVFEDFSGESVADYYSDMSSGTYTVTGDVVGWLQMPHSTWYYDADQCPGARSGTSVQRGGMIPGAGSSKTLVKDAINAINEEVDAGKLPGFDWADYDLDGDQVIDRLWIVHAGYGEEDGIDLLNRTDYSEAAVWSHSSTVTPYYTATVGLPAEEAIYAGPYIMMPENGGIGVFAHESGHNLGADDLYAYGEGETSAGFWTVMADDWTGHPIGYEPPAADPWHLDNWGWLDPFVITDTSKVYEVTLGQASRFPGGEDVYRGAKVMLPDAALPLPVPVWEGDYYWYGGGENLANASMTSAAPIVIPASATSAQLTFDLVYDIEDEWDFLWVQASEDGENWDTLTNANTQCVHDPDWIGGMYGFPDDLCGAGLGGFYGYNPSWPDPDPQTFDLSSYIGKSIYLRFWYMTDWGTVYTGVYVDQVVVDADGTPIFSDNAEAGDANWVYEDPWVRSDGTQKASHNFYLQWRNTNENGGYDSALGDPRWRYGPANTGLLAWYNNNFYSENEVFDHLFDYPGFGPKGRMLVVDSHPDPYRDPYKVEYGYDNEGGNVTSRMQMRDAPFTLADTVDFSVETPVVYTDTNFIGRDAVTAFHDSLGYYPGAEYVSRGPAYDPPSIRWVTKQWDASVVMPSYNFYGVKAPGYNGVDSGSPENEFRWDCSSYLEGDYTGLLGCYWLGSGQGLGYNGSKGNPGEVDGQYGWHAEVIQEAADHTWAKVRIWNSKTAVDSFLTGDGDEVELGGKVSFTAKLHNVGSSVGSLFACVDFDETVAEYVSGSASSGVMLLAEKCPESAAQATSLAADADNVGALAWLFNNVPNDEWVDFNFQLKSTALNATIKPDIKIFTGDGEIYTTVKESSVDVLTYIQYLPLVDQGGS